MSSDPNWEEYTLLQGKIDRIGAAKFQIKGWTVTLITVVILAGLTSGLAGVSMIIMILIIGTAFFLLEREQLRLSSSYGKRVLQLEHVLRSQAKRGAKPEEKSPRVAQFSMGAQPRRPVMFRNKVMPPKVWRAIVNTDNSFYILILVVSVLVLFMPRVERAPQSKPAQQDGADATEVQPGIDGRDIANPVRGTNIGRQPN